MALLDAHHRFIDYLRISVTDRCNLSCVYCKPRPEMKVLSHRDILSYEEILRIAAIAVPLGISHIRVTGGEPLIRRGIIDFIASLKASTGIKDISLTTNGILLEETAEQLRAAGISRLNISLDTLDRGKFRTIAGSDAWPRVWSGIRAAESFGFAPIKINMVPLRGVNDDEIVDFARLTLDRGLHVRFIELMPIGNRDRLRAEQCVPSDQVRSVIEREFGGLVPFSPRGSAGPSDNYQVPGARGVVGFISPMSKHFCGTCRRLRLTADGRIRPCLLSDTEIDIKSPMRSGCADAELERQLRLALEIKPDRHHVNESFGGNFARTMSRIGG